MGLRRVDVDGKNRLFVSELKTQIKPRTKFGTWLWQLQGQLIILWKVCLISLTEIDKLTN
jgi:hypothetical protein